MAGFLHRIETALEHAFPERRLFLRSDTETRFIRLTPANQFIGLLGSALLVGWGIIASAIILMDSIGSGNAREQARRDKVLYEARLNDLATARDERGSEARMAQERFNAALAQISAMQSALLASEDRREELETGIEVVQATLRTSLRERDDARRTAAELTAQLEGTGLEGDPREKIAGYEATLDVLAGALAAVAVERDMAEDTAALAEAETQALIHEAKLVAEKNDRIFAQLEDAVSISLTPLDKMFEAAGLPTERILETVRKGYSGQGGPLTPVTLSTKGGEVPGEETRANVILDRIDRMNLYRIGAQKVPLGTPIRAAFRLTSGFGFRWGRMHEGADMAGDYGTPVYATADGVVIYADWQSAYGKLIKIQHEFGIETRFAHLSEIRVTKGQRVSRGDRIGDMGSTGRSTGTHTHYEVRVDGEPVNPMTLIKAGNDVF